MIGWISKRKRPLRAGGAVSLIGQGCTFEGTLHAEADVRIEGEFKGVIQAAGEVAIGEQGRIITTELHARDIVIAGRLEGRVRADGAVRITSTGRLEGTVSAATLMIEQGAVFQGRSEMMKREAPAELAREAAAPEGPVREEDAALAAVVL